MDEQIHKYFQGELALAERLAFMLKVDSDARTGKMADFLAKAFANTGVQYEFESNYIVLSKRNTSPAGDMSQEKKRIVSGVVKDETGESVIGANVVEKGTTNACPKPAITMPQDLLVNSDYCGR